ncbi:sugar transferase [Aestuariivirga litoralis]|uniref:sugar transferase n=1 Tax=Aestuariivirga litoralis TaxID=2650924 RepID=UPI00137A0B57|nr:sugar transferase [Aestuariivirga litoralis]
MTNVLPETGTTRSMSLMFRERTQFAGAVLLAVIVPFFGRYGFDHDVKALDQTDTSVLVLFAIIASHIFLKSFSRYPSQDPFSTVLPAVTASFAIVLILITAGHLDYSRSLLLVGYGLTLVWYGGLALMRERLLKPRLAVVPFGSQRELTRLGRAEWRTLQEPPAQAPTRAVDGVVADLSADLAPKWEEFIVRCATQGIPIYDSTLTREFMTGEVDLVHAGDIGIDALHPQRNYLYIKSVIDLLMAIAVLPVVLPVLGLTILLIKLDSSGPAFFVQKRVGYRGRLFDCYKLRSMHANAHLMGPDFTTSEDPRITRVGRFIRKYRLDELPQVFNILKGEMSWIGPRPEAAALAHEYERHIPYYAFRHSVKPGITGWAAIRQGNVAEVEEATRKLRNDFFYIKNISASLDAFITVKTMWIVLTGFGSR